MYLYAALWRPGSRARPKLIMSLDPLVKLTAVMPFRLLHYEVPGLNCRERAYVEGQTAAVLEGRVARYQQNLSAKIFVRKLLSKKLLHSKYSVKFFKPVLCNKLGIEDNSM